MGRIQAESEQSVDKRPKGARRVERGDIKKRDHATALLFRKERQRTFVTLRSDLRRPEPPCYSRAQRDDCPQDSPKGKRSADKPVWPVVWGEWVQSPFLPDSVLDSSLVPNCDSNRSTSDFGIGISLIKNSLISLPSNPTQEAVSKSSGYSM